MAKESNKEQDMQQYYVQMQMLDAQSKEIQAELQNLEMRNADIMQLKENVSKMQEVDKNSNSYSPMGMGFYLNSEIKQTNNILVNVGAGVMIHKSVEDATKLLEEQEGKTAEAITALSQNLQFMAMQMQAIQKKLQEGM